MSDEGNRLKSIQARIQAGAPIDVALRAWGLNTDDLTVEESDELLCAAADAECAFLSAIQTAATKDAKAAIWWLEKMYPERWSGEKVTDPNIAARDEAELELWLQDLKDRLPKD